MACQSGGGMACHERRSDGFAMSGGETAGHESNGAGGGGRTHTQLPVRDFESRASASSATPAGNVNYNNFGPRLFRA